MAVKQKVVETVGPSTSSNSHTLDDLNTIIQNLNLLTANPELMPRGKKFQDLCTNVVLSLGRFQMPTDVAKITVFVNSVEKIHDFLQTVYEMSPKDVRMWLLNALCRSISESRPDCEAGPGLVVVLQLIDANFITEAVRWLLAPKHDDASLVRGLHVLIGWLFQWTRNPQLGHWIIAFMNGLKAQKRYNVLEQVTLERIKKMSSMLRLNAYRSSVSAVLFHMLSSMQHTPAAFLIAAEQLPSIIPVLRRDTTSGASECLQSIVDISQALIEHFELDHPSITRLQRALQGEIPSPNYKFLLFDPGWSDINSPPRSLEPNISGKVGLVNLGNTCYMNSILQALFMTTPFKNELLITSSHSKCIEGLQTLFALLQFSKRSAIQPPDNLVSIRPPGFLPGLQHDSSEYMNYLLDTFHEQEKAFGGEGGGSATLVQRTFGGQTVTSYRCDSCEGTSTQTDPFRDIQLSFPAVESGDHSVQTLLDLYLEPEQLCDENRYWCERCRALTNAERILHVSQTPRHLILTLKHFRYDPKSQQRAKLLQRVRYDPHIILNGLEYELFAAVVHAGASADSGHYFTYARDPPPLGIWYKFNDSWVSRSSLAELSALQQPSTPYVLFYQQKIDNQPQQTIQLESLHPALRAIIQKDLATFERESQHTSVRSPTIRKRHDHDEDDEPPPPFCGGNATGGGDIGTARFVF